MKLKWTFSVGLGLAYVAVFQFWLVARPEWVAPSGVALSLVLSAWLVFAARAGSFVNAWDLFIHAAVILDILLEAILLKRHEHQGFYVCAAAFAAVLIGYRAWWQRRLALAPSSTPAPTSA
jgi:hypothetical protein